MLFQWPRSCNDIALQSAHFLKATNPNGTVKLRDLQTGRISSLLHAGTTVTKFLLAGGFEWLR
jgi:hypothetical protein